MHGPGGCQADANDHECSLTTNVAYVDFQNTRILLDPVQEPMCVAWGQGAILSPQRLL